MCLGRQPPGSQQHPSQQQTLEYPCLASPVTEPTRDDGPATPPQEAPSTKRGADAMLHATAEEYFVNCLSERRRSLEADPLFQELLSLLVTRGVDAWEQEKTKPSSTTTPNPPPLLACPRYLFSPASNPGCLALGPELLTMHDLVQHLVHDHRRRPYCPVCWATFPSGASRDRHIVCRSCEAREGAPPDGVTGEQADALLDLLERRGGWGKRRKTGGRGSCEGWVEGMWREMWDVLFPDWKWTGSMYLESEGEMELLMMRRFWDREGAGVVAGKVDEELLGSHGLVGEEAVVAVYRLVLKGMMEQSGLLPEALMSDDEPEG